MCPTCPASRVSCAENVLLGSVTNDHGKHVIVRKRTTFGRATSSLPEHRPPTFSLLSVPLAFLCPPPGTAFTGRPLESTPVQDISSAAFPETAIPPKLGVAPSHDDWSAERFVSSSPDHSETTMRKLSSGAIVGSRCV